MSIIEEIKKREQDYKKIRGNDNEQIEEYKNIKNKSNCNLL